MPGKIDLTEQGPCMMGRDANGVPTNVSINAAGQLETSAVLSGDVNVDSTSMDASGLVGKASGGDFTVVYTSSTTLTVSGLSAYHSVLLADDIIAIVQIDNTGAVVNTYSRDDIVVTVTTNIITVSGAAFVATDTFIVYTNIARVQAYDSSQDIIKTIDQSPANDWYTGSVPLVTASDVGASDNAWVDQGSEIAMGGKNRLAIYVKLTPNNSTGVMLQVLSKDASGGTSEYVLDVASSYQKVLGVSPTPIVYTFETDGVIPFVQIQTKASVVGTTKGTVDISIVKAWV